MKLFIFIILFYTQVFSQIKEICITIDDLPCVTYGNWDNVEKKVLTERLVNSLKGNKIPATGFVNAGKIIKNNKPNKSDIKLLEYWLKNDCDLGNHTFSHKDYNKVTFEEYSDDIIRGETIFKTLFKKRNKQLIYFRHPFLHLGNTKQKYEMLDSFLTRRKYTIAPVTIDNDDYIFAKVYYKAYKEKDSSQMQKIGIEYISYMENKLIYFEKQTMRLFNRNIKQILLIHASLLNADYIGALAAMIIKNNYKFIDLKSALEDEVYRKKSDIYLEQGISWIDRWAILEGKRGDFFKDEPIIPKYILDKVKN